MMNDIINTNDFKQYEGKHGETDMCMQSLNAARPTPAYNE